MLNAPLAAIARLSAAPRGAPRPRPATSPAAARFAALAFWCIVTRRRDELHLPARLLDRRARARGDPVDLDGHRALQLALAEDHDPVAVAAHEARLLQRGRVDHAGEPLEIGHLDLLELAAVDVVEAELREAPLERHLAALEALEVHVAGAGLLALAAAAGGLAEAGRLATADALLLAVAPLGAFRFDSDMRGLLLSRSERVHALAAPAFALRAFRPTGGGASTRFHSTR